MDIQLLFKIQINMIQNIIIRISLLILLFITASIQQSCKDEDKPEITGSEAHKLISYEKVSTTAANNIQSTFALLAIAYPEINKLNFNNALDVEVFRVKYKTKLKDEEITASGLVCIPKTNAALPVLSFQNGTNTSDSDAPSVNIKNDQFVILQNVAGLGYIVTIPDYIGFGESNQVLHPYYHRESSDAAVIDLIQAAGEMLEDNYFTCETNGKLFMLGYSQGGWATLSAFKTLEENNPLNLTPVAASCGAGAYNLTDVATSILKQTTYNSPVYLPYFIESHKRNGFLNTSLDLYFNAPYIPKITELFDGKHYLGSINSALNDTLSRLMTPDMLQNFTTGAAFEPLRNELTANSLDAWNVKGKLLFMHGTNDITVPTFESENIVNDFRQLGLTEEQVKLELIPGANHGSGIFPWVIRSMTWLNEMK
jgi:dienelactone hydrolase